MFQFTRFASSDLCIQSGIPLARWVSPFRHLRIKACLPAPRSFSQATTSFFACDRQGIHHMHLVTWSYNFAGYRLYVLYCYSLLAEFSRLCRSLPIHTHLLFSSLLFAHSSISLAASIRVNIKIKESVKKYALLSLNFLLQCNHNPYASIWLEPLSPLVY